MNILMALYKSIHRHIECNHYLTQLQYSAAFWRMHTTFETKILLLITSSIEGPTMSLL